MNVMNAAVRYNDCVGSDCYRLGIDVQYPLAAVHPGQFVMVQVPGTLDPLLRRPFSIHRVFGEDVNRQTVELLFKVVGKGTEKLSRVEKGAFLNVFGPLGKGFTFPPAPGLVYLVAGGIGIAPLCFLAHQLLKNKLENITVFFGGRSATDVALMADFKTLPVDLVVSTDDGSFGGKGFITEMLRPHVIRKPPQMIYACGPIAMLKAVAKIAAKYKISCQISLEATMACGMGACLGCAVKNSRVPDQYAHVCIDGPVFDLNTFDF